MACKCTECGHVFREIDAAQTTEYLGEYFGAPASETIACCPECGGDYEILVPCEVCGEEYTEEELHYGICDNCFKSYVNDIDTCVKIGEIEKGGG